MTAERPGAPGIELDYLRKRFGSTESVAGVTLSVRRGELAALLGPSGAGKTTILRLIAGHLAPDSGEVRIGGETMDRTPPEKRNVGMVFQNHALFPHRTVRRNVAFGLERRGLTRSAAGEAADEMLARLGIARIAGRRPRQLSGGERQRVAVARALAIRPAVLLFDEPLASLDPGLRRRLRPLLVELHREFGATTLWVTHDQEEALSVADRVAVLRLGKIEQFAAPVELHTRPATEFVARFVGKMNLLRALPEAGGGYRLADGAVVEAARDRAAAGEGAVLIGMRPEVLRFGHAPGAPGFNRAGATVKRIAFLGDRLEIELELRGGHRVLARGNNLFESLAREGDEVRVHWPVADTRLLGPVR